MKSTSGMLLWGLQMCHSWTPAMFMAKSAKGIFINEASPFFKLAESMKLTSPCILEFLWYLLSHYPLPEQESIESSLYIATAIVFRNCLCRVLWWHKPHSITLLRQSLTATKLRQGLMGEFFLTTHKVHKFTRPGKWGNQLLHSHKGTESETGHAPLQQTPMKWIIFKTQRKSSIHQE